MTYFFAVQIPFHPVPEIEARKLKIRLCSMRDAELPRVNKRGHFSFTEP